MRDLTEELREAVNKNECTIIKDTTLFSSDRPKWRGEKYSTGVLGDSDIHAGMSFDFNTVCGALVHQRKSPLMSLNNIRIYGPVADAGFLHYHGFSREHIEENKDDYQFIMLTVQAIQPYDPASDLVDFSTPHSSLQTPDGQPGFVVIHQKGDILVVDALETGDTVVLPSGVYHTFSAAQGIFGYYGAIEVASHPDKMYQAHFRDETIDPRIIITKTIEHETGRRPTARDIPFLTFKDIPSLRPYVEVRAPV